MRRTIGSLALAALLSAALAPTASAGPAPRLVATAGGTLGVLGDFDEGGTSLAVGALWPVEGPLAMGIHLGASDLGTRLGRLRDPNDGTDLGVVALGHRQAYGAAWRLDSELPGRWGWTPYASGTWGYSRVADDVRGEAGPAVSSTTFSLGLGALRPLGRGHSVGASVRYHRLFNDRAGRFVSAGIDWAFGSAGTR
jgi:hypothetical protein